MLTKGAITLALVGLVAVFVCYVSADDETRAQAGSEIRDLTRCQHIELNRQLVNKSKAGRKAFKMAKREAYSACRECCRGLGWKYEYFTYKAAPYQCQCANKYKHVVSAS